MDFFFLRKSFFFEESFFSKLLCEMNVSRALFFCSILGNNNNKCTHIFGPEGNLRSDSIRNARTVFVELRTKYGKSLRAVSGLVCMRLEIHCGYNKVICTSVACIAFLQFL
jgi:hypothetical protein